MSYKDFFRDKKVAIVGVGEHGLMLSDMKFLLKLKARLSVYDLRSRDKLGGSHQGSVAKEVEHLCSSAEIGAPAACHFGLIGLMSDTKAREIVSAELAQADLIILAPDVSRNVSFLKAAAEAGVRIEYPDTLLFKLVPSTMLIGVMGSIGKSAVASALYSILHRAESKSTVGVFHIDVEAGGVLQFLKKIKKDDILVARMPEHLMDEYRQARITPHVAVLTHVSRSLASMGRKFFGILEFQTYNSFVVASDESVDILKNSGGFHPKAKILRTGQSTIPADWHIKISDTHSRANAALAVEAANIFKVDPDVIHLVLSEIRPLKGRLEKIKVGKNGVEFYNDSMSVRPESTLAALRALGGRGEVRSIILILGGSYTGVSYHDLISNIPQYVSHLILLPGSGTFTERTSIEKLSGVDQESGAGLAVNVKRVKSVEEAVAIAKDLAGKGDRVLFSPAFDIVGSFESRQARGEEFAKAVRRGPGQNEKVEKQPDEITIAESVGGDISRIENVDSPLNDNPEALVPRVEVE